MSLLDNVNLSLTPARVVRSRSGLVEVALLDEVVWAVPALSVPRDLHAEDRVLVIRQGLDAYIIGVIESAEPITITAATDLRFHAPAGSIECAAGERVSITAGALDIIANRVQVFAHAITECFNSATRAVKGLLITESGSSIHEVTGEHMLRADSVTSLSKGVTRIDGSTIHLG